VAKLLCLVTSATSAHPVRKARPVRRRFLESVSVEGVVVAAAEKRLLLFLLVVDDFGVVGVVVVVVVHSGDDDDDIPCCVVNGATIRGED